VTIPDNEQTMNRWKGGTICTVMIN